MSGTCNETMSDCCSRCSSWSNRVAGRSSGGFLKYILFGILGMSVGGLVVMDVTGVFNTGGIGGTDVAKVEGRTISIQE